MIIYKIVVIDECGSEVEFFRTSCEREAQEELAWTRENHVEFRKVWLEEFDESEAYRRAFDEDYGYDDPHGMYDKYY